MFVRIDKKPETTERDATWGTLEEIISNACIPLYHREDKAYKYRKSGVNLDRQGLLKFLINTGIDIKKKTPLTRAACKKYIYGKDDKIYDDEFYQRFSDTLWACNEFDVDIKAVIATILSLDDMHKFDKIWCFISTCYDYGLLGRFIAKDVNFISTIFNVNPEHLENVRMVLIQCRQHLEEIISKKETFIDDLMSIDPRGLARCICSLHFNDMSKERYIYRGDKILYNVENILVLLNEKKIKCYYELDDILWAINDQAEFDMLVENATEVPFIHQSLLKANNSSRDFKDMPSERFSACLSSIISSIRLLNNPLINSNNNGHDDVRGDEVISRPGRKL